jgi:hypothetical protein
LMRNNEQKELKHKRNKLLEKEAKNWKLRKTKNGDWKYANMQYFFN